MPISTMEPGLDEIFSIARNVDVSLNRLVNRYSGHMPSKLAAAVAHSLLAPAKRLRGSLMVMSGRLFDVPDHALFHTSCSVELVHAASLILDDLPCMDDATMRRGLTANHVKFGEGTAILAAVGLLNEAFAVLHECPDIECARRMELTAILSKAVGFSGLVSGQFADLNADRATKESFDVNWVHNRKTGVLFGASAEMGAAVGGADQKTRKNLYNYGMQFGLAFQAYDDLLDVLSSQKESGKNTQQDNNRVTLVSSRGAEEARAAAVDYIDAARAIAREYGGWEPLIQFADLMQESLFRHIDERLGCN